MLLTKTIAGISGSRGGRNKENAAQVSSRAFLLIRSDSGRFHLNKPDWGEAVGSGGASAAGGAACRSPAPQAPAGQARQNPPDAPAGPWRRASEAGALARGPSDPLLAGLEMESGAVGCSKQGLKPGLPPLRAVVVEVRPAAPRWLRPGNASCGSNVPAFFLELGENLPHQIRRRGVRADPGFRLPPARRGGGPTEPAGSANPSERSPVDDHRSAGHGRGRVAVSGAELAAPTAAGAYPASGAGGRQPWRQTPAGRAGESVSSSADERLACGHAFPRWRCGVTPTGGPTARK